MNKYQAKSSRKLPKYITDAVIIAKNNGKKIVLVTGVFDIIHIEHENFLRKAKNLGDILIIATESDKRVVDMKGPARPVNSSIKRVDNLIKLGITKLVFVLPDLFDKPKDHTNLIKTINPNILAVSSHTAHLEQKKRIMELVDGKLLVVHEHNPDISSTKIIEKL